MRSVSARYRFNGTCIVRFTPTITGGPPSQIVRSADVDVSGSEYAIYVADRVRISSRLVAEAGVRLESESYTPDGAHVNPRINLAYGAGERTSVRAAWGRFAQAQNIYELQVEDGISEFAPAQLAEHRVIGIDHAFSRGVTARLEIYDKEFTNLRPRFENIFNRMVLFPELRRDRLRIAPQSARSRGAELTVRTDPQEPLSGWLSYARSSVTDEIDGRTVPRSWDQRDALTMSINYRRGSAWNFNLAGIWHSGWPTTPVTAEILNNRIVAEAGELNSARLPDYRRFDFRASRNVPAGHGMVSFFVELFNVFNQANILRLNGFDVDGTEVSPRYQAPFGIVPSFGVTWQF
jgi:outer membrane receptor protein involved in Fe transport